MATETCDGSLASCAWSHLTGQWLFAPHHFLFLAAPPDPQQGRQQQGERRALHFALGLTSLVHGLATSSFFLNSWLLRLASPSSWHEGGQQGRQQQR
jgi:hypothetical protein